MLTFYAFADLRSADLVCTAAPICGAASFLCGLRYKAAALILLSGAIVFSTLILALSGVLTVHHFPAIAFTLAVAAQIGYLIGVFVRWQAAKSGNVASGGRRSPPYGEDR